MNDKTLKALEGSIDKWSCIGYGLSEDLGRENCQLCNVFYAGLCFGCPVYKVTERRWCEGSPYEFLGMVKDIISPLLYVEGVELELNFLCSLLPEDHPWYEVYDAG